MIKFLRSISIYFVVLLLYSCSVQKFLPEDKTLYTGAELEFDNEGDDDIDKLESTLKAAIDRSTNSKFLGMRPGLYFHFKANRDNPGLINKFLNKQIGEDPYYFEDINLELAEDVLKNRLQNSGYFGSIVNSSVEKDSADQSTSVLYSIKLSKPYRLSSYQVEQNDKDSLQIYH